MIEPPITDGSGYRIAVSDLNFLAITPDQVTRWRTGTPLGLSQIQLDALCAELASALQGDGVALEQIDLRVKGSSASFFSGHHKAMPQSRSGVIDAFRTCRGRFPERWEIDEIMRRLTKEWLTEGPWPQRRPFDSLYRLNVAREPSDYDLQISSDEIVRRCEDAVTDRGQDPSEARVKHPVYNFVRRDLVAYVLPRLDTMSLRMADALGRHITLAVFPSAGPPDTSETYGELSAHFRESDCVLRLSAARDEADDR